jgi:uncharacterized membrane-anchored protein
MLRIRVSLFVTAVALVVAAARGHAQSAPRIEWQAGPMAAPLGDQAEIQLPEGFLYTGPKCTKAFMELNQNPVSGRELGIVVPADTNATWFALYVFDESGYVKDDEKDKLDADKILESLRAGTEEGNKERKRRGWSPVEITGWHTRPRYNEVTHNLEWAAAAQSEGHELLNYSTRLLGRHGVMKADLVCDPAELATALPMFQSMMTGFRFARNTATPTKQGDKLASYGLTALIAGGAGVALAKSGLLAKLWKVIVLGAVALFGAISRLWKRLTGQREEAPPQA